MLLFFTYLNRWNAKEWDNAKRIFAESLGHQAQSWATFSTNYQAKASLSNQLIPDSLTLASTVAQVPEIQSNLLPKVFQEHAEIVKTINRTLQRTSEISERINLSENLLEASRFLSPEEGFMGVGDINGYQEILQLLTYITEEHLQQQNANNIAGFFSSLSLDDNILNPTKICSLHNAFNRNAMKYFESKAMENWNKILESPPSQMDGDGYNSNIRSSGQTIRARLQNYIGYLHRSKILEDKSVTYSLLTGHSLNNRLGSGSFLSGSFSFATSPRSASLTTASKSESIFAIYAFIYYSLRGGYMSVVVDELKEVIDTIKGGSGNGTPSLSTLQNIYGILQAIESVVDEDCTMNANLDKTKISRGQSGASFQRPSLQRDKSSILKPHELRKNIQECRDDYQRLQNQSNIDPFLLAVLNLVSLAEKRAFYPGVNIAQTSVSVPQLPQFDFYDLLWTQLWFISVENAFQILLPQSQGGAVENLYEVNSSMLRKSMLLDLQPFG
jgi:hypothetical protein